MENTINHKVRMALGAGIKLLIDDSKKHTTFLGLFGAYHYPEVSTFAEVAGCEVTTKTYSEGAREIYESLKKEKEFMEALAKIAKKVRIERIDYHEGHDMGISPPTWE